MGPRFLAVRTQRQVLACEKHYAERVYGLASTQEPPLWPSSLAAVDTFGGVDLKQV